MKKFNCDKCTYSTNYNYDLKRHSRARHPDTIKKFKCDKCNYSTNYNHHLKRHSKAKHPHGKSLGENKSREKICLCVPMFYIVQIPSLLVEK